eukprot:EC787928.1.p3 GENE.EC787928.1~~EC787928.1.p3  ORF type:complete len:94 (+),score=11.31 EC787928.1:100-381(+)
MSPSHSPFKMARAALSHTEDWQQRRKIGSQHLQVNGELATRLANDSHSGEDLLGRRALRLEGHGLDGELEHGVGDARRPLHAAIHQLHDTQRL